MLNNIFGKSDSLSEEKLKIALDGLVFCLDVRFTYIYPKDNKNVFVPSYILPLDFINGYANGFFMRENGLFATPIGFKEKSGFCSWSYYEIKQNSVEETLKPDPFIFYLPLKLTDLAVTVNNPAGNCPCSRQYSKADSAKELSKKTHGMPLFTYSIDGAQMPYPLIILQTKADKLNFSNIFKTDYLGMDFFPNPPQNINFSGLESYLNHSGIKSAYSPFGNKSNQQPQKTVINRQKRAAHPTNTQKPDVSYEINWLNPKSIVAYLDRYIIGQPKAKETIAVAFSNYMVNYLYSKEHGIEEEFEDKLNLNLITIGPSGVGKTYLASLLAKMAAIPMIKAKMTGKSSEGYKGENLSAIFKQIRSQTDDFAPYSIVFLDEIDKTVAHEGNTTGFGYQLQEELIGWLDNATVTDDSKEADAINTKNILFFTAGAFGGLEEIIAKRLNLKRQIGILAQHEDLAKNKSYLLSQIQPEDMINYGLMAELVGRLPNLAVFEPLSRDDLVNILLKSEGSVLKKYESLFRKRGYKLLVDPLVPETIISHCPEQTGARALEAVCTNIFTKIISNPETYTKNKLIEVTPDLTRRLIDIYGYKDTSGTAISARLSGAK